jgi:hypothetical protein
MGVGTFWILPDYPETSKWLTPAEAQYFKDHLHKDSPRRSASNWNWSEVKALFKDPTFFLFTFFWVLYAVGAWGMGTVLPRKLQLRVPGPRAGADLSFIPEIILDMGITGSAGTNLLQIPPSVTAVLFCVACSYIINGDYLSAFPVVLIRESRPVLVAITKLTAPLPCSPSNCHLLLHPFDHRLISGSPILRSHPNFG